MKRPSNLAAVMTTCEELHLVGSGCPYDGECECDGEHCQYDDEQIEREEKGWINAHIAKRK